VVDGEREKVGDPLYPSIRTLFPSPRQPTPRQCQDNELALRRQIDYVIGRALVDPDYAATLLAQPGVALDTPGCLSHQFRTLQNIRVSSLRDFAREVRELFWPSLRHVVSREAAVSLEPTATSCCWSLIEVGPHSESRAGGGVVAEPGNANAAPSALQRPWRGLRWIT
jgi:hypothetical protein